MAKGQDKHSSDKMATLASKALQSNKSSATTKSLAASVMSQSKKGKG
jgi:hypothetical protein